MRVIILCVIYLFIDVSHSEMWPKGVVHFSINPKDYDIHSQDEIMATFAAIEKEICIKFFNTPLNYNTTVTQKVLYISNPDKQKNCPKQYYNYSGRVVNMPIGYNCINKKDIAKLTMDMLKASIEQSISPINSFDLVKKFEEQMDAQPRPTFLTTDDRNYINAYYHKECSLLSSRATDMQYRRMGDSSYGLKLSEPNEVYYKPKVWPYGIVMYYVDDNLRDSDLNNSRSNAAYRALQQAMTQVELTTCVVFHELTKADAVKPRNYLLFTTDGEEDPEIGFKDGEQRINLQAMTSGAPGHSSHILNNLMRTLGVPMMSNRYDRDNYVSVLWSRLRRGKERFLEKQPKEAWVMGIPYDFNSVTHASANYLCGSCKPGENSVYPLQDFMWKRSLEMGRRGQLSDGDQKMVNLLYSKECRARQNHGRE